MSKSAQTTQFLTAGIIACPFYILLSLLLAVTRDGFDMVIHPASFLSLGSFGWIQIANFVLTGLMLILCGVGIRRIHTSGVGSSWLPRLFYVMGAGMLMGGVFTADPSLGFPPGAPAGLPESMSWHAAIHGLAPIIASLAHTAILIILARWAYKNNMRPLAVLTIVVTILMHVLITWTNATADWQQLQVNFLPMWAGIGIGYLFTAYLLSVFKAGMPVLNPALQT